MLTTQKLLLLRRSLHTTLLRYMRRPRKANAGIGNIIKEFDNYEELEENPEGFADLESDFLDVHKTHRQHEGDVLRERERIRHLMVKHKYFREPKLPNLLTYAEKEQIRLLHARDPEEWSAERLAESFPATPMIIQKILRAKWRPQSAKRLHAHDDAVIRNWEKIRNGGADELQLPTDFQEHLRKFADRKPEDIKTLRLENWPTRIELPKPNHQEFLSIITGSKKYEEPEKMELQTSTHHMGNVTSMSSSSLAPLPPPTAGGGDVEAETYLLDKVQNKRKMRFQEAVQHFQLKPAELNAPTTTQHHTIEKRATEELQNPTGTGILAAESRTEHNEMLRENVALQNFAQKFQSNEIVISAEDRKLYDMSTVKPRICIPRKVYRKGATYRVEDCYYDDDGEFLYRVPGMTGQISN